MGRILCSGDLLSSFNRNKQLLFPQPGPHTLIGLMASYLLNVFVKYFPFNLLSFNSFYFNLCLAGTVFQNSELLEPRVPETLSYPLGSLP